MTNSKKKNKTALIILLMLFTSNTYAQDSIRDKKHYISISLNFAHFYNKEIKDWAYLNHLNELHVSLRRVPGIEYKYFDSEKKKGVSLKVNYNYTGSYIDGVILPSGTASRNYSLYSLSYLNTLLQSKKIKLLGKAGLEYRHGRELIFMGMYAWESIMINFKMRDIGIHLGVDLTFELPNNILIITELKESYFVYRAYDKEYYDYFRFNRKFATPLHVLTASIGLGYRF